MASSLPVTLDQARAAKPLAATVFAALATAVGVGITRINDGYGLQVNLQSHPVGAARLPT